MRPVHYLGVFIPAAVVLELAHAAPVLVFCAAALGVIPCAAVMGEATEAIAAKTGPGIGGLLNVTFGNAPELIIAFFALLEGLQEVVKASIVGSIDREHRCSSWARPCWWAACRATSRPSARRPPTPSARCSCSRSPL